MSVANIWKLQENTAPLCRKISQNVGRTYREASGEHRDIVQNICETLRISAMRGSGYVWPGKLKRSPLPSGVMRRMQNILMECQRSRIPDVRHPGGMAAEQNSGCDTSGWNGGGATPSGSPKRKCGALPYPDQLHPDSGFAYGKGLQSFSSSCFWAFHLLCHGFQRTVLNLGLLWWSKSYQNTKT